MDRMCFADGDKIGVFDGEKTTLYESEYIVRFREYAETRTKNDEWKYGGEGARFRGDYDVYRTRAQTPVDAYINGVQFDGEKVVYAFTVNGSSGVYRKDVTDEKAREEHILSASDFALLSLHRAGRSLAVTVGKDGIVSSVGVLDMETSELRTLTEGDSRDANSFFSVTEPGVIYFDSAGVGRTQNGEFSGKYAPATLCAYRLDVNEIEELASDKTYSFVKPKQAQNGDLYCIKRPNREKKGGNVFLDIVLFPFRILKAIFGFLQAFVSIFGHTSLTSATEGGDNPARGRKTDARKLYVDGSLIEAEKEMKRNRRRKDADYGFIPASWKLVRLSGGKEETVKSGVCDFALCKDGGLYCTNGRRIFYINGSECRKVANTERCLCVGTDSVSPPPGEIFML